MSRPTRNSTDIRFNVLFYDKSNDPLTTFPLSLNKRNLDSLILIDLQGDLATSIKKYHDCTAKVGTIRFWIPRHPLPFADLETLDPTKKVSDIARMQQLPSSVATTLGSNLSPEHVHFIVTATLAIGDHDKGEEEEQDSVAEIKPVAQYYRRYQTLSNHVPLLVPSKAAKSKEYAKHQKNPNTVIYDGTYIETNGAPVISTIAPPVEIFCAAFAEFTRKISDPSFEPKADAMKAVSEFMSVAAVIHSDESVYASSARKQLTGILRRYMGKTAVTDGDRTSDGRITKEFPDLDLPLVMAEFKRALGEGGCDAMRQAAYSTLNHWAEPSRTSIREKCCCPTFILAGGGADLTVLGSVWTDKFVVQRLTDIMWFGQARTSEDQKLYRLATIFTALRECQESLDSFYQDVYDQRDSIPALIPGEPHPRFFPYPSQFKDYSSKVFVEFTYVDCLEDDPASVTFLALTKEPTPRCIVVKFVDRYGYEAHELLAAAGFAPNLLYCGLLDGEVDARDEASARGAATSIGGLYSGPWRMVIMDFVDGTTMEDSEENWPVSAYMQIETVLETLHRNGFVFGDLRPPNVIRNKTGKIMFIDFDWCGKVGVVRYPRALAKSVKVGGALDFELITKEHDIAMLKHYFI